MTTPAEHAAEVRYGFSWVCQPIPDPVQREARRAESEASLDALAALAERATELEREVRLHKEVADAYAFDYEQQRARAEHLETALGEIRDYYASEHREGDKEYQAVIVARAALDGGTATERYGCVADCRADAGAGLHSPGCRVPPDGGTATPEPTA